MFPSNSFVIYVNILNWETQQHIDLKATRNLIYVYIFKMIHLDGSSVFLVAYLSGILGYNCDIIIPKLPNKISFFAYPYRDCDATTAWDYQRAQYYWNLGNGKHSEW